MQHTNYFLILGLPTNAGEKEIEAAFDHYADALKPSSLFDNPLAMQQGAIIIAKLREACTALQDTSFRTSHREVVEKLGEPFTPEQLKPFLGHVCVAANIISYDELMDAVEEQMDIDLPLGQILQERGLLSQTELDGMLMGQKLYGAPTRPLETMVKRLISMGVITLDMIRIGLIDQRTSMDSLDELISKRGWIEKPVLVALHS